MNLPNTIVIDPVDYGITLYFTNAPITIVNNKTVVLVEKSFRDMEDFFEQNRNQHILLLTVRYFSENQIEANLKIRYATITNYLKS